MDFGLCLFDKSKDIFTRIYYTALLGVLQHLFLPIYGKFGIEIKIVYIYRRNSWRHMRKWTHHCSAGVHIPSHPRPYYQKVLATESVCTRLEIWSWMARDLEAYCHSDVPIFFVQQERPLKIPIFQANPQIYENRERQGAKQLVRLYVYNGWT